MARRSFSNQYTIHYTRHGAAKSDIWHGSKADAIDYARGMAEKGGSWSVESLGPGVTVRGVKR